MSRVDRRPWGAILVAPKYPAVHEANLAWVDSIPKGGPSQVLLELDTAMRAQGISFRHLEFSDPHAAYGVQEGLVDLGYRPLRAVGMVRLGTSVCIRNPDLEVREANTPEELELFAAVMGDLHGESGYTPEVSRALIDRHRARLPALREKVHLGLLGGEAAGIATLVPRERLALIAEVGTRPKFRRRGVARTLVEEVSNRGQEAGYAYVGLVTPWDNEPARALYASLGYQPVGEIRGFHKD